MIPFPILGGEARTPTPPVPLDVSEYRGYSVRDSEGVYWRYDSAMESWSILPVEADVDHPLHLLSKLGHKIGTDGSFRGFNGDTWFDIVATGTGDNPLITEEGANIGISAIDSWPVDPLGGSGWDQFIATSILGDDTVMDIYYVGMSAGNGGISGSGTQRATRVLTNVKRGKFWCNLSNALGVLSNGEVWAFGTNMYNQYGPWANPSPSNNSMRRSYWQQISIAPDTEIDDCFLSAWYLLYRDTEGKFWSKGVNQGQFNDTDSTVRTSFTEIPSSRFEGFVRFYQNTANFGSTTDMQWHNTCYYGTDQGVKCFGSHLLLADGVNSATISNTTQRNHILANGLPTDAGLPDEIAFTYGRNSYWAGACWYSPNPMLYTLSVRGYWSGDLSNGTMGGKFFRPSSLPVRKSRPIEINFNRDATIVHGFDGRWYGSGNPTVNNGMAAQTNPLTFTEQKIGAGLVRQFSLPDEDNGKSVILTQNGLSFKIAGTGSDIFSNSSLWVDGVAVPSSNPWRKFKRSGNRVLGMRGIVGSTQVYHGEISDVTSTTYPAQDNRFINKLDFSGSSPAVQENNQVRGHVGGYNQGWMFSAPPTAESSWVDLLDAYHFISSGNTIPLVGSTVASSGTILNFNLNGNFYIFGKNWWDLDGGQPVIRFQSGVLTAWNHTVQLPNFHQFIQTHLSYEDENGEVPQPYFMYRGTDGKIYACGSNTTGCLGTGNDPSSRTEQRWTFEEVAGSDVFEGKQVTVYSGEGASCLLFLCEGKMYGLGAPNRMTWNQAGDIVNPFYPGFNRRLNSITYLGDVPEVFWRRK